MGYIQTFGCHIDGAIRILFADHVHMTLDDYRLVILVTLGGITKEDHIIEFILDIAQVVGLGKVHQVVGNHLSVIRAMGNGTNFFKITEYSLRLQTCKSSGIHMHTPPYICIYSITENDKSK